MPFVPVICHDRLNGVAGNPLESIHSLVTNTLHHGQVKIGLPVLTGYFNHDHPRSQLSSYLYLLLVFCLSLIQVKGTKDDVADPGGRAI
jgi:hypothetical protein